MNPSEALGLNPRRIPKQAVPEESAPAAENWLRNPAALVARVSLAMRLESEPEHEGPPFEDHGPARPIVTNEEGGILLD